MNFKNILVEIWKDLHQNNSRAILEQPIHLNARSITYNTLLNLIFKCSLQNLSILFINSFYLIFFHFTKLFDSYARIMLKFVAICVNS